MNILVRDAIQTGALATTWAIAGLVPAFFMPHNTVYRIFDATSGSVYTVVGYFLFGPRPLIEGGMFQAIFETLISRTQLRGQMLVTTSELGDAAQVR